MLIDSLQTVEQYERPPAVFGSGVSEAAEAWSGGGSLSVSSPASDDSNSDSQVPGR